MPYSSPPRPIERARPLLGTVVRIRCRGGIWHSANRSIDAAFREIARVQELMSFHEPDSDVSRLNAHAVAGPLRVHAHTFAVLQTALEIARASDGAFDITIADRMVAWGLLPRPASKHQPDGRGSWQHIELVEPDQVAFHMPLWIDLGGIAKGYAVDLALATVAGDTNIGWCINAGGDIRVAGPAAERVGLRNLVFEGDLWPVLELENGSLASSGGIDEVPTRAGAHVHGRHRGAIGSGSFAAVVAENCVIADAMTKVVLAERSGADSILKTYGATAFLHQPSHGWTQLGAAA
jgi:thiamine biosynthesis lipoprotein